MPPQKFTFACTDIRYRNKEVVSSSSSSPKSSAGTRTTAAVTDDEFSVLEIPPVTSTNKLPVRGMVTDIVVKKIRDTLWVSPASPPDIETPGQSIFIRKEGDAFEDAIEKLLAATEIGVSVQLEPGDFSPRARGRLLSLATKSEVYIFDLEELGPSVFKWGLGDVLASPDIIKVIHDGRVLSDILLQYGAKLLNFFDTLAAHFVFAKFLTNKEINRTKALYSAVRDYMGVTPAHLNLPGDQTGVVGKDLWMVAVRDTMYLLELKRFLQLGLELPVRRATEITMRAAVTLTDDEAAQRLLVAHVVPNEMETLAYLQQ